ncbi:BsuPI-related putative proteinase inhibitor [Natranaeroarchaeum sulfidigenes]|uniref:Intracellular proteinase inhibitor related protein, contains CARDB domain n=1 Tax=Natranaeroarchaeum sulfidigenes TaxID=2784880 RepID=A0A897MM34_9EURY|nr:BsuPI-related putative proteinase inhibitor [Natranaeroarchaeum sulfidigenes]QSG01442.1 Intracellular proteinase inhibitor related protein, contains CARDB domain [Natranaeroarchaeum sulfidigenes]
MSLEPALSATIDRDVTFRLTVTNAGSTPVELTFRDGRRADIVVYGATTDEECWRWSDGKLFTQAIERVTLAPGDQFEREYVWSDPPSGEYVAVAALTADEDVTARVAVTI